MYLKTVFYTFKKTMCTLRWQKSHKGKVNLQIEKEKLTLSPGWFSFTFTYNTSLLTLLVTKCVGFFPKASNSL